MKYGYVQFVTKSPVMWMNRFTEEGTKNVVCCFSYNMDKNKLFFYIIYLI